jgi:hypothetical protein
LVEFLCVLAREISGTGENQVTFADILDQPDHASGLSNLIGRWCSWCEIQAGSVPDSFVCLCYWIWIWIWIPDMDMDTNTQKKLAPKEINSTFLSQVPQNAFQSLSQPIIYFVSDVC